MKNYSKPKKRRFAGGGSVEAEAAAKEAGLKASKGEDVGFFKRLGMGNIDDPSSEAYKQFGAGRGRTRAPVSDAVPVPVTRTVTKAPEDDSYDRLSAENAPVTTDQYIGKPEADKPPARKTTSAVKPSRTANVDTSSAYGKEQQYQRAQEAAQSPEGKARRKEMEAAQALEASHPEFAARGLGGLGLKSLHKAAKNLASRDAAKSEAREEVLNPLAWMAGPKGMGEFSKSSSTMSQKAKDAMASAVSKVRDKFGKKKLSEADTTGGAIGYRKGGTVSASRRGDGIAQKGKTRGKYC